MYLYVCVDICAYGSVHYMPVHVCVQAQHSLYISKHQVHQYYIHLENRHKLMRNRD